MIPPWFQQFVVAFLSVLVYDSLCASENRLKRPDFRCGREKGFTAVFLQYAPIAQLDRALDYGSRGWGFELSWARQRKPLQQQCCKGFLHGRTGIGERTQALGNGLWKGGHLRGSAANKASTSSTLVRLFPRQLIKRCTGNVDTLASLYISSTTGFR